MPNVCHYHGDQLENLRVMAEAGHLFGPDSCGPQRPGEVLGHGAFWEFVGGEYDPAFEWPDGTTGRTTANFKPYVDPRARIRYHGGSDAEPDTIGAPTLAAKDDIRRR